MKKLSCLALLLIAGIHASPAQVVLSVNFDGQTVGAQPTGATGVRPTTNEADVYTEVIDAGTNKAGSNEGVRILDNDNLIAPGLDYNFVADTASQLSNLKVEFNVAHLKSLSTTANFLTFSMGNYSSSTSLQFGNTNNRAFQFQLFSDGDLRLSGSTAIDQATTQNTPYKITFFINDNDTDVMTYSDPQNATDTLAVNSVVFYLDNQKINTVGLFGDLSGWDNSGASFGRLGFAGVTTSTGLDWNIDNIVVTSLPIPEPSAAGLALVGLLCLARGRRFHVLG